MRDPECLLWSSRYNDVSLPCQARKTRRRQDREKRGQDHVVLAPALAAVELYKIGWRFIGVVKTAHKQYPKTYLEKIELPDRGTCAGLRTRHCNEEDEVDLDLMAFVFCDRDRHYFISTCSSLSAAVPITRIRTQQVQEVDSNNDPERLLLTIHQPKAASIYYSTCGKIDQHNRCRQDTLNLEKKLETKQWQRRVNMSIFGMVVVDSWMIYKGCTGGEKMDQTDYYKALIDGLIDNTYYDQSVGHKDSSVGAFSGERHKPKRWHVWSGSSFNANEARESQSNPLYHGAVNTDAKCVKRRLLWFAQFAGKMINTAIVGLSIVIPSPIAGVFENMSVENIVSDNINFSLLSNYQLSTVWRRINLINFQCVS
jgi:Transposase IS4